MSAIWATNPNWKRGVSIVEMVRDANKNKARAARVMAFYDKQPRDVREAIGRLNCAIPLANACRYRRLKKAEKLALLAQLYQQKLDRSAVLLDVASPPMTPAMMGREA